jgi:tetratricopeptide (TPR) repeat protein
MRINWNKQEIHSYRQALRLEPNDYPTVQLLSRRLWSLKRHTEAVQILQEFLQISPVHNMAWAKLADWLTILKQDEEAIAAYQMAIQYGQTGDRLTHQGNLLYHLNRLISLQPDNADHFYQRACLYSQLGDQARTIADLSQAIQINPAKYRQRSTWENVNVTALMLKHRGKIRVR